MGLNASKVQLTSSFLFFYFCSWASFLRDSTILLLFFFTLYCCPNLFVRKANGRAAPGKLARTIHAEYLKTAPKVSRSIWFSHSDWCLETKGSIHAGLHSSLIQLVTENSHAIFYCLLLTAVTKQNNGRAPLLIRWLLKTVQPNPGKKKNRLKHEVKITYKCETPEG